MGFLQVSVYYLTSPCTALGAAPPPIIHVQTCSSRAERAARAPKESSHSQRKITYSSINPKSHISFTHKLLRTFFLRMHDLWLMSGCSKESPGACTSWDLFQSKRWWVEKSSFHQVHCLKSKTYFHAYVCVDVVENLHKKFSDCTSFQIIFECILLIFFSKCAVAHFLIKCLITWNISMFMEI